MASYCPVYDKSPVKATLAFDPGSPSDNVVVTCVGAPSIIEMDFALR